jgi:hypothetical protein
MSIGALYRPCRAPPRAAIVASVRRRLLLPCAAGLACLPLGGCGTVGYYSQAGRRPRQPDVGARAHRGRHRRPGHARGAARAPARSRWRRASSPLTSSACPTTAATPATSSSTARRRLQRVRRARVLAAAQDLVLPGRRLRGLPRLFLRGARPRAGAMPRRAYDTWVGGAAAYSTLGRFEDPLLSTMLYRRRRAPRRAAVPRARAPAAVRQGRLRVQRGLRHRGRGGGRAPLARRRPAPRRARRLGGARRGACAPSSFCSAAPARGCRRCTPPGWPRTRCAPPRPEAFAQLEREYQALQGVVGRLGRLRPLVRAPLNNARLVPRPPTAAWCRRSASCCTRPAATWRPSTPRRAAGRAVAGGARRRDAPPAGHRRRHGACPAAVFSFSRPRGAGPLYRPRAAPSRPPRSKFQCAQRACDVPPRCPSPNRAAQPPQSRRDVHACFSACRTWLRRADGSRLASGRAPPGGSGGKAAAGAGHGSTERAKDFAERGRPVMATPTVAERGRWRGPRSYKGPVMARHARRCVAMRPRARARLHRLHGVAMRRVSPDIRHWNTASLASTRCT